MLKQNDFNKQYGMPVGRFFRRFLSTFTTLTLSVALALSLAACKNDEYVDPGLVDDNPTYTTPNPDDPSKEEPPVNPGPANPDPSTPDPDNPTNPDNPDPDNPTTPDPDNPEEPDDPGKEKFVLDYDAAKNIEANVTKVFNYYAARKLPGYTVEDINYMYLTSSDNTEKIDTIGAVFSGTTNNTSGGGPYLTWGAVTFPEEISMESLSTQSPINADNASSLVLTGKSDIFFSVKINENKPLVDTLVSQTATEEMPFEDTEWIGWSVTDAITAYSNSLTCYSDGLIKQYNIRINTNGQMTLRQAVEQNFLNKQPSPTTYTVSEAEYFGPTAEKAQGKLVVQEGNKIDFNTIYATLETTENDR